MLKIGPVPIGLPAVQAALSGYSDAPMRAVSRSLGAPYAVAEMILDELLSVPGKLRDRHLRLSVADHPVGGQLVGSRPENFAVGAGALVAAGFDVVDINFGCPLNKVLGRCRGGYLLSEPATALEIIDRVRAAVPERVAVSVKMRRGLDDSAESRERFWQIFDGAFARGVSAVTVHGRTVRQKYVGPADWAFLAEVKAHAGPSRTVLGSGDLFTPTDVVRMLSTTGLDGVTVARGSIGNPWIFAEAAALLAGRELPTPPTVAEQTAVIRRHREACEEVYGPLRAAKLMRKFAIHYSRRHPDAEQVWTAMTQMREPTELTATLARWYSDSDHRIGRPTGAPLALEAAGSEAASSQAAECSVAECA